MCSTSDLQKIMLYRSEVCALNIQKIVLCKTEMSVVL